MGGPPPGYGPSAPYGGAKPGNGLAVAGMVLGILSFLGFFFFGGVLGVVGLILSLLGLGKAKRIMAGKGMAIAGIILNVLAMLGTLVVVVAVGSFFVSHRNDLTQLQDCLNRAGTDTQAQQLCSTQFGNSFFSPGP